MVRKHSHKDGSNSRLDQLRRKRVHWEGEEEGEDEHGDDEFYGDDDAVEEVRVGADGEQRFESEEEGDDELESEEEQRYKEYKVKKRLESEQLGGTVKKKKFQGEVKGSMRVRAFFNLAQRFAPRVHAFILVFYFQKDESGQLIMPFNVAEEQEEGHFDAKGNYVWGEDVRDAWLAGVNDTALDPAARSFAAQAIDRRCAIF